MIYFTRRDFVMTTGLVGAGLAALGLVGCGGNEKPAAAQSSASNGAANTAASGKVLVAYYSAQGHTKRVAQAAADVLGANLFEIVPAEVYSEDDLDWTRDQSRVTREHEDESLRDVPLAQTTPDNWADYDTVLLGYPIWWAIAAWPCNHFAADNDFSGKRVIPFCTSTSSGLGQSGELLANAAGTGDWQDGKRFSSGVSDNEVRSWAAGI